MANAKRYARRYVFVNDSDRYKDIRYQNDIKILRQYSTPELSNPLRNTGNVTVIDHVWKTGDRYYKLADEYYDRPTYWWVIALFNSKPTEGHIKKGEIIRIPVPLENFLRDM